MKTRVAVSALIVVLLLAAPVLVRLPCGSAIHGGLVCYCCKSMGPGTAMISCPKCMNRHGGYETGWVPDALQGVHTLAAPLRCVLNETETPLAPESVYLDVPLKPPIHL